MPAPFVAARMRAALRRWLGLAHLALALAFGLPVCLLGLTGGLLVYRGEIEAALAPGLLRAAPPQGFAPPLPLPDVLEAARRAVPDAEVRHLFVAPAPGRVHEVWTADDRRAFVDPYTGDVRGVRGEGETPLGWVLSLHTHLLDLGGHERGERIVGWTGVALFSLSLSGLLLWWPARARQAPERMRPPRSLSGPRGSLDLHRFAGFWASGLLLLVSGTGVALVFKDPAAALAYRLTGGGAAPKAPKTTAEGPALPLAELLARANAAAPGGVVRRVSFPAKPGAPLLVRKSLPGDLHPNGMTYLYLDPATGALLRADVASAAPPARRMLNARYPLHIGAWGGAAGLAPLTRALHAALGAFPSLLFVTGVRLWLRKRRRGR